MTVVSVALLVVDADPTAVVELAASVVAVTSALDVVEVASTPVDVVVEASATAALVVLELDATSVESSQPAKASMNRAGTSRRFIAAPGR